MSNQPNILLLMTDQHHAAALGFMGHPMVKTPHLDALAARGAWFRNMFSCSAICAPSRTSFMTGTYLRTHGHMGNCGNLRRDLASLPALARAQGYRTGVCGKSHVPDRLLQHFDVAQTKENWKADLKARGLSEAQDDPDFHQKLMSGVSRLAEKDHTITWTADRAVDFLAAARADQTPFFLWCSFSPPHAPHTPTDEYDALYNPTDVPLDWDGYRRLANTRLGQRAMVEDFWSLGSLQQEPEVFQQAICRYLALITMVDKQVGRLLGELEAAGLAENTLVIFTADHGDFAGRFGQLGKNIAGYDDLLRIPFIYADPARRDAGRCVEGMFQNVDLFPTLCERLGWETPPSVQGESLMRALDGWPTSRREHVYAETPAVKTVRSRDWKLNFHASHPQKGELFRMGPDPDETTNRWDDPGCGAVKAELMGELAAWMVRCEQLPAIHAKAEPMVQTRWNQWLAAQPHECEDQDHWHNRL